MPGIAKRRTAKSSGAACTIAIALVVATGLGTLAAGSIPTGLKVAPNDPQIEALRADGDQRTFYVEPGPQDLSPPQGASPLWLASAMQTEQHGGAYPPGYASDYALADTALAEEFDEALGSQAYATGPASGDVADEQAADAAQVAQAVQEAEAPVPASAT